MGTKRIVHILLQVCIITAIAVLFSRTAIYSITSVPAFNSSVSGGDFKMSDIYNSVVNSKNAPTLSPDIKIVNVDDCSRLQIAEVLKAVNEAKPKAIGLDVMFPWQYAEDDVLIDAIRGCGNIVLPCRLKYNDTKDGFEELQGSYFYNDSFPDYGIVNFESYAISSTVREFCPSFSVDGKTYSSMPTALASIADPYAYQTLQERGNTTEFISYSSVEFETISGKELLGDSESLAQELFGKIVFVGDIYDGHDFHITPIDNVMPGVKIQAYATQTILSGQYTRMTSSFFNWMLAILTCMLFISLNFISRYNFPNVGKIVLRLLQILCLYLFYFIGCRIFANHQIYIDFMPALTMMALGLFAYDIWVGSIAIVKKLHTAKHSKK